MAVATKDQEKELLATMTWAIHAYRHLHKLLTLKEDLELCLQSLLWAAHSVAAIEIIQRGEVYEQEAIYKALEIKPELFQVIYLDLLTRSRTTDLLVAALNRIDAYLEENGARFLKPLLHYLDKQGRVVPLSEISDHFAFTQLYPCPAACLRRPRIRLARSRPVGTCGSCAASFFCRVVNVAAGQQGHQ